MYPPMDAGRFRGSPPTREQLLEYQASAATWNATHCPPSMDSVYMHPQRNPAPAFRCNVTPRGLNIGAYGVPTFGMHEPPARRNEASSLQNSATRPVFAVPRPVQLPPTNRGVSTLPLFPGAELPGNRSMDEPPRTPAIHPLPNILRRSSGNLPPIAAARASLGLGRTSAFHHFGQSRHSEAIPPQADAVVYPPDCYAHHEEQLPPPAERQMAQFWNAFQIEMKRFFDQFSERNMHLDSAPGQVVPQLAPIPCGGPSADVILHRPVSHAAAPHPYPAGYVEASDPRLQHVQNIMQPPAPVTRRVSAPSNISCSSHGDEERMIAMPSDSEEAPSMPNDSTNINEPACGQSPQSRGYDLNVTPEDVDTDQPMEYVDTPAPQMPTAAPVHDDHTLVHERHIMPLPSHTGSTWRGYPLPPQLQPQPQPGALGHLSHFSHPQQQLGVLRQPAVHHQLRQPQQQPQGFGPPAANLQYEHQRVSLPHQQPQEHPGDILRQPSVPHHQQQQPQDPYPAREFTPSVNHRLGSTRGTLQPQQAQQEQSGAFGPHAQMLSQEQMRPFGCRHAHILPHPQSGPSGGHAPPQLRTVEEHALPFDQPRALGGRPPLPWQPRPFGGHMQPKRVGQHDVHQEQSAGALGGNALPDDQPMPFGAHAAPHVQLARAISPNSQPPVQPGAINLQPEPLVQSGATVPNGDNMMQPQEQPEEANLPIVRRSQEEAQPGVIIGTPVDPQPQPRVQPKRKRGRPVRPRSQEQMQPANNMNIAAPAAPRPQPIIPVQQQDAIEQNVQVSHGTGDPTVEEAHVIVVGRLGGDMGEGGGDGAPSPDQHVAVRCDPFAPCVNCLAFFGVPAMPIPRGYLRARANGVAHYHDYEEPPMLDNGAQLPVQRRRQSRHGPKSQSSEFRGVTFYKRTGRWEAHIWHNNAQVYLGASQTKEDAARAYDRAALLLTGPTADINFTPEDYRVEITHLYKLSKEQLIIYVRRDSRGKGAQAKYPGVKKVGKDRFQAAYKPDLKKKMSTILGLCGSEGDASRVIFNEALRRNNYELAALIMNTHHVRSLPSYIAAHEAADGIVEDATPDRAVKSARKKPAATKRKRSLKPKVVAKVPGAPRRKRQTKAKAKAVVDPPPPPAPPAATGAQKRKRQTKAAAAAT